jgi:hypothetical protein
MVSGGDGKCEGRREITHGRDGEREREREREKTGEVSKVPDMVSEVRCKCRFIRVFV